MDLQSLLCIYANLWTNSFFVFFYNRSNYLTLNLTSSNDFKGISYVKRIRNVEVVIPVQFKSTIT